MNEMTFQGKALHPWLHLESPHSPLLMSFLVLEVSLANPLLRREWLLFRSLHQSFILRELTLLSTVSTCAEIHDLEQTGVQPLSRSRPYKNVDWGQVAEKVSIVPLLNIYRDRVS